MRICGGTGWGGEGSGAGDRRGCGGRSGITNAGDDRGRATRSAAIDGGIGSSAGVSVGAGTEGERSGATTGSTDGDLARPTGAAADGGAAGGPERGADGATDPERGADGATDEPERGADGATDGPERGADGATDPERGAEATGGGIDEARGARAPDVDGRGTIDGLAFGGADSVRDVGGGAASIPSKVASVFSSSDAGASLVRAPGRVEGGRSS